MSRHPPELRCPLEQHFPRVELRRKSGKLHQCFGAMPTFRGCGHDQYLLTDSTQEVSSHSLNGGVSEVTSKSIFRMRRRLLAQAESWTGLATGKKEEERCMCQFRHSQWGRHMKAPSLPPAFIRSAQSEKRGCARSARLTRLKYELRRQAGLDRQCGGCATS